MSKFGALLGLKTVTGNVEKLPVPTAAPEDKALDLDEELFSPLAIHLGEENEAVRNLLVDAGHKIRELDTIREAFGKLVDPVNKTLRAFEEEKSEKISLQGTLNDTRASYAKARNDLAIVEKKATTFETECQRLRQDLSNVQQNVRALEGAKAEQAVESASQRTQITDLQRRLTQEVGEREATREESRRFSERLAIADKRIVQLESDIETGRQKLLVAEREKATLQNSLDHATNDSARMSRKIVEAENTLTVMQGRLRQMESNLAEATSERTKLALAIDELNERHQSELKTQKARFEALQSRSTTTDKLLDEARASLMSRAEELRSFDRRAVELSLLRNALESKVSEYQAALEERDAQIQDLAQSRAALVERTDALNKAVRTRDHALTRADEQLNMLNDRLALLEGEMFANRETAEKQIEELNALVQRERVERSLAEGALEAGRKDLGRLLREVATLQGRKGASSDYEPLPVPKYNNAA